MLPAAGVSILGSGVGNAGGNLTDFQLRLAENYYHRPDCAKPESHNNKNLFENSFYTAPEGRQAYSTPLPSVGGASCPAQCWRKVFGGIKRPNRINFSNSEGDSESRARVIEFPPVKLTETPKNGVVTYYSNRL